MNPRDIEDYKCSSCKRMWAPSYFGWNERTGARLNTCSTCRWKRLDRERANREREAQQNQRILDVQARQAPELTPEPVLWDAAAEMNMYTESDTEMDFENTAPLPFNNCYVETATGDTETYCGENETEYWNAGGYGPIREPIIINVADTSEEDRYIALNPSSSSAAASGPYSYFRDEPDPEPRLENDTDSD